MCAFNQVEVATSGLAAPAEIAAAAGQERVAPQAFAVPGSAPLIPTGVSAMEGNGSVTVTWKPSEGATSYNIYHATSPSVSKKSGTKVAGVSGHSYTVRPLKNKTPYFFVVTAVNAAGESGDSPWVMATPLAKAPKPELLRIPAGPVDGDKNPRGPDSSDRGTRVRRGGGFKYGPRQLKCSGRMFRAPTYTAPYFGFRSAASKP
jgi:hypothetical protein